MNKLIKNRTAASVLAFTCALFWSLAYPLIKLGYREIGIAGSDLGSKMVFAGIRFTVAGLIVLLVYSGKIKESTRGLKADAWGLIVAFALVNTSFHYMFSYIGLGFTPSSRGSVIDSTSSFILIILSCLIFADDKMSLNKALGCCLGFLGILILNITPGEALFSDISFMGDGMLFLNAIFGAAGGILNRFVAKKADVVFATGFSVFLGGVVLLLMGCIAGIAGPWTLSPKAIAIMLGLSLISAYGFTVFNSLMANHPISRIAIYNAFIPVLGVFLSSLILGEPFKVKCLIAGLVSAAGIFLVNGNKARK